MEINGIIEENSKIELNYRKIEDYIGQEEKGAILQYPGNRVILVLSDMLSTKIDVGYVGALLFSFTCFLKILRHFHDPVKSLYKCQ